MDLLQAAKGQSASLSLAVQQEEKGANLLAVAGGYIVALGAVDESRALRVEAVQATRILVL